MYMSSESIACIVCDRLKKKTDCPKNRGQPCEYVDILDNIIIPINMLKTKATTPININEINMYQQCIKCSYSIITCPGYFNHKCHACKTYCKYYVNNMTCNRIFNRSK